MVGRTGDDLLLVIRVPALGAACAGSATVATVWRAVSGIEFGGLNPYAVGRYWFCFATRRL